MSSAGRSVRESALDRRSLNRPLKAENRHLHRGGFHAAQIVRRSVVEAVGAEDTRHSRIARGEDLLQLARPSAA